MLPVQFDWPPASKDVSTFSIELGIFIIGIIAVIIGLLIWKNNRILAKKGMPECISGFVLFAFHSLFDALDTLVDGKIYPVLDSNLDSLDSIFSIIGLVLIAIGIIRIAFYGAQVWKEL